MPYGNTVTGAPLISLVPRRFLPSIGERWARTSLSRAGGFNYPRYPVLGPVMMCALMQTALRLRYDSMFITSFFHASINAQGLGIVPMLVVGVSPILGGLTGIIGIMTWASSSGRTEP